MAKSARTKITPSEAGVRLGQPRILPSLPAPRWRGRPRHRGAALMDLRLARDETVYPVADRLRAKGIPFAFSRRGTAALICRDVPVLRKPFGEAELAACVCELIGKVRQTANEQKAA